MRLGTKSILFGVHAFWLHPFAVAYAWWKLYGFPWDPRLWVAFIVHDWGYWGCENMDGPQGKVHPWLGGRIMDFFFGSRWGDLVYLHSRHYAKILHQEPSQLCAPDKLASVVFPAWLYLSLASATGELTEYMRPENCTVLEARTGLKITDKWTWYQALKGYLEQETKRTWKSSSSCSS